MSKKMYKKEMKKQFLLFSDSVLYRAAQVCFELMLLFIFFGIVLCAAIIPLYVCGYMVLKYLQFSLSFFVPAVVTGCIGSILKISLYIKYNNKKTIPSVTEEIAVQKVWNSLISETNKGIEWGFLTSLERKSITQLFIEYSKAERQPESAETENETFDKALASVVEKLVELNEWQFIDRLLDDLFTKIDSGWLMHIQDAALRKIVYHRKDNNDSIICTTPSQGKAKP